MSARNIYYKSDVLLPLHFTKNGSVVVIPDHDFILRFYTGESSATRHYDVGCRNGEYFNCAVAESDPTLLVCYIKNHGLGVGSMKCEYIDLAPVVGFENSIQRTYNLSLITEVNLTEDHDDSGVMEMPYSKSELDAILAGKAGKAFLVTFSSTTDDDVTTYSADKTVAQILAAYQSGQQVIAVNNNEEYGIYTLSAVTDSIALFESTLASGNQMVSFEITGNGVTYTASELQSELTFDNTPTQNSNNPVKSGGVYTALGGKQDKVRAKGANYMGYKELDATQSFASQVTQTDTIYVVQTDYDLNSGSVTIPAGSVLKFEGGSLSNGTIVGQGTSIVNESNTPILYNISAGSSAQGIINDYIPVDWFVGSNDSAKIQAAVDFAKVNQNGIKFLNRTYTLDTTVVLDLQNLTMVGVGSGGELGRSGTRITVSNNFSSTYSGNPMFYCCGTGSRDGSTLGTMSFRIDGIQFLDAPNNDVFHLRFDNAPARPFYVTYCLFYNVSKAIKILDNGKSTNVGWLIVEKNTFQNNSWNVFAEGNHSIMNMDFRDNVAEQCQGCINIGYSDTHSATDAQTPVPTAQYASATCLISIENNLLEGTVDAIYIYGGTCIYKIIGNYFERGTEGYKQFIVLMSTSYTTAYVLDNHNTSAVIYPYNVINLVSDVKTYHNPTYGVTYGFNNIKVPCVGDYKEKVMLANNNTTDVGVTFISSFSESTYKIYDGQNRYKAITSTSSQDDIIYTATSIPANSVVFVAYYAKKPLGSDNIGFMYRYRKSADNTWISYQPLSSTISTNFSGVGIMKVEIPEAINILTFRIKSLPASGVTYYIGMPTIFYVTNKTLMDVLYDGIKPTPTNYATSASTLPTSAPTGASILLKSIGKHVYWNGTKWVEEDGAGVGVKRNGATADRPILTDVYEGFEYYDTSLRKEVFFKTATGTSLISQTVGGKTGMHISNTCVEGNTYRASLDVNVTAGKKMIFRKAEDSTTDQIVIFDIAAKDVVVDFIAPSATTYPYIYLYNDRSSGSNQTFLVKNLTTTWVDSEGYTAAANSGATADRPTLTSGDAGFKYFDTTLGLEIVWNGSAWIVLPKYELVNALPASPDSNTLYLIAES